MSSNSQRDSHKHQYKVAKKHYKKQAKRLEDELVKRLKQRLKAETQAQLPLRELSQQQLIELAAQLVDTLLPTESPVTVSQLNTKPSTMSFALVPHKSTPCKACPAKAGGLCACAIKASDTQKTG